MWALIGGAVQKLLPYILIFLVVVIVLIVIRRWRKANQEVTLYYNVQSVATGNTFTIKVRRRRISTVRLRDIAVPSNEQRWGREARDALAGMLAGRIAEIHIIGQHWRVASDLTAIVFTPERRCCQLELVRKGLAWCTTRTHSDWLEAENEAKSKRLGVWSNPP